jgi:hypothetical protein
MDKKTFLKYQSEIKDLRRIDKQTSDKVSAQSDITISVPKTIESKYKYNKDQLPLYFRRVIIEKWLYKVYLDDLGKLKVDLLKISIDGVPEFSTSTIAMAFDQQNDETDKAEWVDGIGQLINYIKS